MGGKGIPMSIEVQSGDLSISVEEQGRWLIRYRGREISAAQRPPRFRLAGKIAEIEKMAKRNGAIAVSLVGDGGKALFRLYPRGDVLEGILESGDSSSNFAVDVQIPFPRSSAIEIPVNQKWSARVDDTSINGRPNGVELTNTQNQIAAVEVGEAALAFIGLADHTRYLPGTYASVWKQGAFMEDGYLWLHIQTLNDLPFEISCHPDLEGCVSRYCQVLHRLFGIRTLSEETTLPQWFDDPKIFVAFEMWRSDGEILNDFGHVVSFCEDLKKLGVTRGVVVNLLGFQGPFDSRYPYFDPADQLGGSKGLEQASRAVHDGKNRLRMHFNVWGLDPYLENFNELEHLAMPYDRVYERIPTGQIGPYDGWPGPYPAKPAGFDSGLLPLSIVEKGESHLLLETCDIPEPMEAHLSLFGVRGFLSGMIRAEIGGRQVKSLPGHFTKNRRVRFRFRFRFRPGGNQIRLDFSGGMPDLKEARYRIDGSVTSDNVWSYPIVRADIHHPEWIELTRNNLVRVCRDYGIDIPYIDAISIWRQEDKPIFDAIRDGLPGRAFGCEYPSELGYNMFRFTGTAFKCLPTRQEKGYIISDFTIRINRRFTAMFSAGRSYVSFGRLNAQLGALEAVDERRRALAERHQEECHRLGIIPGVRLNYRDHGLDEKAKKIILEETSS
jgi:hypothetical protein